MDALDTKVITNFMIAQSVTILLLIDEERHHLARQLLGLSPRRPSLYPGDWSLAVCVLTPHGQLLISF